MANLRSIGVVPISAEPARQDAVLSRPGSSPAVLQIVAREDLIVARAAAGIVGAAGAAP